MKTSPPLKFFIFFLLGLFLPRLALSQTPTSFAAWQAANFTSDQLANPAICGNMATPAMDGIPNLLKYALNLQPMKNGAAGLRDCRVGYPPMNSKSDGT